MKFADYLNHQECEKIWVKTSVSDLDIYQYAY